MKYSQLITGQRRVVIAFLVGFIFMEALALTPAAAAAFSTWLDQDSAVPPLPVSPDYSRPAGGHDNGNPAKPYLKELVNTSIPETSLTG